MAKDDPKWSDIIKEALGKLGGVARLKDLYRVIENLAPPQIRTNTEWRGAVREAIFARSSDSKHFGGKEDIFYSVGGLRSGIWGLKNFDSGITPAPDAVDLDLGDDKQDLPNRKSIHVYRIIRDTAISRRVKELYEYKCQICSYFIELPTGRRYAEAHHIKPLGAPHKGPDIIQNILCLCPNHHVELDYGIMELRLEDLVTHESHDLDDSFIKYHNSKIYKKITGP